jgi:NADH-quinone oxidoreductase subunit E
MAVLSEDLRAKAEELKGRYPDQRSAMLPLLYLVQSVEGYVSREGMREIAEILGLTTADVEAVATFYTMIRKRPTGKYLLAVCTNVSCALLGSKELYERSRELLGPNCETVTADGLFTLHEEECLGACEQAPVVLVNFLNYARMNEERLRQLVDALRAGSPPASSQGPVPPDWPATCRTLAGLSPEEPS